MLAWKKLCDPSAISLTHLIAAGWEPGPRFRVVLDAAEKAQDDGESADEAGALAWFERNYGPRSTRWVVVG